MFPKSLRQLSSYENDSFEELEILSWENYNFSLPSTKNHVPALHFKNDPEKVVLYFHGNGSDLGTDYPFVKAISERSGWSLYFPEYIGYGTAKGNTTEKNVLEVAENAFYKLFSYKYKEIVILGRSIGTGPASWVASLAHRHSMAKIITIKFRGLILISPFTSIKMLVKELSKNAVGESLSNVAKFIVSNMFDNYSRIQELSEPVVFIHGRKDTLISCEHSKHLATVCNNKKLYLWQNSDHNTFDWENEVLIPIFEFLK